MRQHNKYLEKVFEEMSLFRDHLLTGKELTTTQAETFRKVDIARAWLKDGYSDTEVLNLLKNNPSTKLMDRRAREVLAMAYETFAELRVLRNPQGIKFMYAEAFREAAFLARDNYDWENYMKLLKEAAKLDGAYDAEAEETPEKKKPTKIEIKRVNNITNNFNTTPTKEIDYEIIGDNSEHSSE